MFYNFILPNLIYSQLILKSITSKHRKMGRI